MMLSPEEQTAFLSALQKIIVTAEGQERAKRAGRLRQKRSARL